MKPAARQTTEPAPLAPPPAVAGREPAPLAPPPAAVRTEPAPLAPPPAVVRTEPAPLDPAPAFDPRNEATTVPRAYDRAFSELATEIRPPDQIASAGEPTIVNPTTTAPGIAPAPFGGGDVPIEEWSVPVEPVAPARAASPGHAAAAASPSTTAHGFAGAPTTPGPAAAPAPAIALAPVPALAPAFAPRDASRADTGFRADTPAPLPAAPVVPAPLPAPPIVSSANGSGSVPASTAAGTDALHPRAPSDWIADRVPDARAPAGHAARRDPSAVGDDVLVAAPLRTGGRNKKLIALVGGGVLLLFIVVFAATRGGGSKTTAHTDKPRGSAETVAAAEPPAGSAASDVGETPATPEKPADHHATGTAAIATPNNAGSAGTVASHVETPAETGGTTPAEPPKKHNPTIGGKKVVLEYDTPTHETAKPAGPEEDSAAVQKARAAYAMGNKKLFAGDADGAVKAYQAALAAYPGYVAGYRGLGLAYAQTGDKLKAMSAFHMYLSAVPGAKDAPLIKKRLAALNR